MTDYCPFSGKAMHASAGDAMAALKRLSRAGGAMGAPYRCPNCSAWHHSHGRSVEKTRAFKRLKRNTQDGE